MPHPTQTYESHSFWWLVWMDRHLKVSTTHRESICCFIRFLSLYNLAVFYTFKTFLRFFFGYGQSFLRFSHCQSFLRFFFPLSRFLAVFFHQSQSFLRFFFTTVKVSCGYFFPLSEFLAVVLFFTFNFSCGQVIKHWILRGAEKSSHNRVVSRNHRIMLMVKTNH